MNLADPSHVAAEELRLAWLAGWEIDWTKGSRRSWVKLADDGDMKLQLRVYRGPDGSWAAAALSLTCDCVALCPDPLPDSLTGREVAEAALRALTEQHNEHARN